MSAEEARFAGRRILALGASAAAIAGAFEGGSVQSAILSDDDARPRAGAAPVVSPASLVANRLFRDAHVVVALVVEAHARALFRALACADLSREIARPLIVMVADDALLSRAPADVLVFSDEDDRARYQRLATETGFDSTNAVVSRAPGHAALLDQCAALLQGQDMRGSALPLRPVVEPDRPAPRGLIASALSRFRRA